MSELSKINLPALQPNYEISANPTQAIGMLAGREFYFLAKHSQWCFEVANDFGDLPSDVGGEPIFLVQSRNHTGSNMTVEEANSAIAGCANLFLSRTFPRL